MIQYSTKILKLIDLNAPENKICDRSQIPNIFVISKSSSFLRVQANKRESKKKVSELKINKFLSQKPQIM